MRGHSGDEWLANQKSEDVIDGVSVVGAGGEVVGESRLVEVGRPASRRSVFR